MENKIVYCSPTGKCYPINDVAVKNLLFSHERTNRSGGIDRSFHEGYAIYNKKTGENIDTFSGIGFGSEEEALDSIERNKIFIPGDWISESKRMEEYDEFDYQKIEDADDIKINIEEFRLYPVEAKRLGVFMDRHSKCGSECTNGVSSVAIPIGSQLIFTTNSVGRSVAARCPHCGKIADITDYDLW